LNVTNLQAVSANTGNLNVTGTFQANTAAISGTTMTGSGGILYSSGNFAFGNSTGNIVFNGSNVYINGISSTTSNNTTFIGIGTSSAYPPSALISTFVVNQDGNVVVTTNSTIGVSTTSLVPSSAEIKLDYLIYQNGILVGTWPYYYQAQLCKINPSGSYGVDLSLTFASTAFFPTGTYAIGIASTARNVFDASGNLLAVSTFLTVFANNSAFQAKT
jgi:hypothetical protein